MFYSFSVGGNTALYSKSPIFVQKFNFDKAPTISRVFHQNMFWQFFSWNQSCQQLKSPKPQHFHEFFIQIFFIIFLVKSKLSTAKKPKTTTFSRVFHPKKIDNFLGKSKLNFWTKNEDSNSVPKGKFEEKSCGKLSVETFFSKSQLNSFVFLDFLEFD